MRKEKHIYTVFDELIDQSEKENLLGQRGVTIWLTGLSGSGKSTLASYLERSLHKQGRLSTVLDGDNIRSGLNGDLSFSQEDRSENIRRIAEVSKLFNQAGVICINSFVSPTHDIRAKAKSIIGDRFIEVFVDTPLEICEERDVKGLYALPEKVKSKTSRGLTVLLKLQKTLR